MRTEGILSDEGMLQIGDGTDECVLLVFECALADAGESFIGEDLHEHPVRAVAVDDKGFDGCDFHVSFEFRVPGFEFEVSSLEFVSANFQLVVLPSHRFFTQRRRETEFAEVFLQLLVSAIFDAT